MKTRLAVLGSILVLGLLAACGGDDNGTPDNGVMTDTNNGTDVPVTTTKFTGQLADFQSKTGREGVDLQVLDNVTGEPIAGIPTFKSGPQGAIEIDFSAFPDLKFFGLKATGKDANSPMTFQTTYMFNLATGAQNKRVYAVNVLTYNSAIATAGVVIDHTKGILAGTIYWPNAASGEEEFVGCATVKAVPADGTGAPSGDVRYFDCRNDLPTGPAVATQTSTGEDGGEPGTSRYIIANLPEGQWRITAAIDGADLTTENPSEIVLHSYPDSICITNLYVIGDKNPTPDRPECIALDSECEPL